MQLEVHDDFLGLDVWPFEIDLGLIYSERGILYYSTPREESFTIQLSTWGACLPYSKPTAGAPSPRSDSKRWPKHLFEFKQLLRNVQSYQVRFKSLIDCTSYRL